MPRLPPIASRTAAKALLVAAALPCSLLACPESGPDPVDSGATCEVVAEWGQARDGGFAPFEDGDEAEITLGFQGFRYIDSMVHLRDTAAKTALLSFRVDVEGHEAYSQASVEETVGAPDGRYAVDILVFFNDIALAQVLGRKATISLAAQADGCKGFDEHTVTLVDEESCVDLEDGGQSCDGG